MIYDTGKELTAPHNSGKFYGELSTDELRMLSPELSSIERASPFAMYFDQPMEQLQPGHEAAINGGPIDPSDGCMPNEIGPIMLTNDYAKVENGYCVLPNGVGYAAAMISQPGRTEAKVKKFREGFAQVDDLYYKTWFPGAHLLHYINGAVEDFGWGMLNMEFVANCTPEMLSIDPREVHDLDSTCISIIAISGIATPLSDPTADPEYLSMFCYLRETPSGRELRVRYWVGLLFSESGIVIKIPQGPDSVQKKARLMMQHCMHEYTNENRLLNAFCAE